MTQSGAGHISVQFIKTKCMKFCKSNTKTDTNKRFKILFNLKIVNNFLFRKAVGKSF